MRELTFNGFLTKYVRTLSAYDTNNVARLTQEAATSNARLREPLYLYAVWSGKQDTLQSHAKKQGLDAFYGALLSYDQREVESSLESGTMPAEYQKVWNSYLRRRDRYQTDKETKELMRQKILKLQSEKKVTNYRIYTDLALNPGNLNSWLKHGNGEKVSLETARNVLKYLKN